MKIDNAIFEIDNRSCDSAENHLIATHWAGWQRCDAADCKSVRQISHLRLVYKAENAPAKLDKTPGHIANERKTLTTPSAWLPVAMALGFVAWAYIIGGVV